MTHTATLSAEALVASLRTIADHSFDSIMITRGGKESPIVYVYIAIQRRGNSG